MILKSLSAIATFVFAVVVYNAFSGWLVMLALGGLHSIWSSVPALGYFQSFIVALALGIVSGILRGGK